MPRFQLDPSIGEFMFIENIKLPENGGKKIYSCNEGNSKHWDPAILEFVEGCKGKGRRRCRMREGRINYSLPQTPRRRTTTGQHYSPTPRRRLLRPLRGKHGVRHRSLLSRLLRPLRG